MTSYTRLVLTGRSLVAVGAVTDRDGFFTLPYLQPSSYTLEVEAAGFRTARRENVTLMVAEKLDLPVPVGREHHVASRRGKRESEFGEFVIHGQNPLKFPNDFFR